MWVSDAVFGVVLLLLATAIVVLAQAFPAMPGQDYGPALFPTLIAAGFGVCGLVLLVRTMPRVRTEGLFHVRGWEGGWGGRLGDVLLIVGGLVVWILVWNPVGFLLGATAYAGMLMTRFRGRPVSSLALGLALALVIDWSFRRLLLVPLPLGPFTGIIW